jgi:hypothetical protein
MVQVNAGVRQWKKCDHYVPTAYHFGIHWNQFSHPEDNSYMFLRNSKHLTTAGSKTPQKQPSSLDLHLCKLSVCQQAVLAVPPSCKLTSFVLRRLPGRYTSQPVAGGAFNLPPRTPHVILFLLQQHIAVGLNTRRFPQRMAVCDCDCVLL